MTKIPPSFTLNTMNNVREDRIFDEEVFEVLGQKLKLKRDEKLEGIYKTSTIIPHKPDYNKIDALCIELVEKSFSLYR